MFVKLKRGNIKMKIEEQVLSIEQMKHLQELGVDTSDASLVWYMSPNTNRWKIKVKDKFAHEMLRRISPERYIPTYTTGDLFRKLPSSLKCDYLDSWIAIHSDGSDDPLISASYEFEYNNNKGKQVGDTIEEALYNLLCWVAINHKELLEVKK